MNRSSRNSARNLTGRSEDTHSGEEQLERKIEAQEKQQLSLDAKDAEVQASLKEAEELKEKQRKRWRRQPTSPSRKPARR